MEGVRIVKRILTAAAALAVPASGVFAGLAVPGAAGASSPITCAKVTGSLTGTVHFKGCHTPWASGNAVGTDLANGGSISWAGKHAGSVSFSGSVTSPGQGSCPTGSTEYSAADVVTAVTGGAASLLKVGESVSGTACRTKAGGLTVVSYHVSG
jgi:hypothetical protein